jgi:membrane-associated protein
LSAVQKESELSDLINVLVEYSTLLIDVALHLDSYLAGWVQVLGPWTYVLLFLVIFAETGLVVTPFLPGDSLLFAAGAIASIETAGLNVYLMAACLITAGILGDFTNYRLGKFFGPQIFTRRDRWFLNPEHLTTTEKFYERHGSNTIILARFVPIVRTFAPFVAGIGKMNYSRFFAYNAIGAVLWVVLFLFAGYFFGNLPAVKRNFHIVIFSVIGLSLLPMIVPWAKSRMRRAVA